VKRDFFVDFSVIEQRLYPKYCERQEKSQCYEKSGDCPKGRIAPQAPDHPGSFFLGMTTSMLADDAYGKVASSLRES
jgi:hypothetical protein